MPQATELDRFFATWEYETQGTLKLLHALPRDQYDFRPDARGRSLGERLASTNREEMAAMMAGNKF